MKPKSSVDDRTRRSIELLALIVFCGFFYFAGLQLVGLVGADEPRYAQVAREMLNRHDWVTPVLFGRPWLEKPPLYYWCAALAYKGAGQVIDWAARLPSSILTTLMIFFIYSWARRFRRGMQLDAALITAGSAMVIGFSRGASTDMPLTAMFTLALLSWWAWYESERRSWLLLFYLFAGFATLAKGPVAVFLAGAVIVLFAILQRNSRIALQTLWPFGLVLYLAVVLPWFIAVQRANPDFFHVFIVEHNLARYATNLYQHRQPFWYFLPVALIGFVPWTVFVVAAVVDAVKSWRRKDDRNVRDRGLSTFLTLWLLVPIVFFSFSQSKLPGYILPAIPAGTILLANYVRMRKEQGDTPRTWMIGLHALLCAALLLGAFLVPFKLANEHLTAGKWTVTAALGFACLLTLSLVLRSHGYRMLRFVTLIPVLIAFALMLGSARWINVLYSARPIESHLQDITIGQVPTVAVYDASRAVEYGLEFYRNRPVFNYSRKEIPAAAHVVVAAEGTKRELEYLLPGRTVTLIGRYSWQHLDFYYISASSGTPKP